MRPWSRPLGFVAAIVVIAGAYYIGRAGRGGKMPTLRVTAPDPGYAARDAEIIETGYDGRERYRLKAAVIRQQLDASVIELEHLEMDYHPGSQTAVPARPRSAPRLPRRSGTSLPTRAGTRQRGRCAAQRKRRGHRHGAGQRRAADAEYPHHADQHAHRVHRNQDPVTMSWSGHEIKPWA
jgi:hypothetical protein